MKAILCGCLLLLTCQMAAAQCCNHCGCESNCRKVCRPICEIKKVPKVTYDCECEEFCVPGKSEHRVVCDDCGNKRHVYTPTCGKVRTRKKLVKNETFEEKVTYRWVVETLCCECEGRCAQANPAQPLPFAATVPDQGVAPVSYSAITAEPPAAPADKDTSESERNWLGLGRLLKSVMRK